MVFGHSFGTNLAFEALHFAKERSKSDSILLDVLARVDLFISVCGISFEYLNAQNIYQEYDQFIYAMNSNSEQLRDIVATNCIEMFDILPDYLNDSNSKQFLYNVQGTSFSSHFFVFVC